MKKLTIFFVYVAVIATIFCSYGCKANNSNKKTELPDSERIYNEYVAVYHVQFNDTNLYSYCYIETENSRIQVDANEYGDALLKGGTLNYSRIEQDKIAFSTDIENIHIGDYFYGKSDISSSGYYYKSIIKNIVYDWLYVQIINSKTIQLKTNSGVRVVSSDFYNIDFFN